jgi:hypothetical protein
MDSRTRTQLAPLLLILPLLVSMPAGVEAGFIKFRQLKETASAPVLVVGRILDVRKGERVPDGTLPWKAETLAMTADIQVLRSYAASGQPVTVDRIQVHYLAYGPTVTFFINGYPPPLPDFEPGLVRILPLQENKNPASELWQLTADSGANLIIPARAEIAESEPPRASARAFLNREIANALSMGTPQEVSAVAIYLAEPQQDDDLTGELMPLLEPAIGGDPGRWAEVAANLLAAEGTPRPSVADLLSTITKQKDWPGRQSLFLTQAALQKLTASPQTDRLLIQTWIADAPLNAWGSANSLLEFGDNPVTTEMLRQALGNDLSGSSYIAWTLVRNGHQATLPEALTRALKVADSPNADFSDLQGAAALLRDYGNDSQLKQLAALVRKYQIQDEKFYGSLWQYASEAGNPREARVLAVVLLDRRTTFGETRYCDFALGVLEKAVGQNFGSGGGTMKERDEAVSRALAWLKSQGLLG